MKEMLQESNLNIPPVYFYRCPTSLIPALRDEATQAMDSCPTLLLYKNGQLVHKLRGPDAPGLSRLLVAHAPSWPEYEVNVAKNAAGVDDDTESLALSDCSDFGLAKARRRMNDASLEVSGCFSNDAMVEF